MFRKRPLLPFLEADAVPEICLVRPGPELLQLLPFLFVVFDVVGQVALRIFFGKIFEKGPLGACSGYADQPAGAALRRHQTGPV